MSMIFDIANGFRKLGFQKSLFYTNSVFFLHQIAEI